MSDGHESVQQIHHAPIEIFDVLCNQDEFRLDEAASMMEDELLVTLERYSHGVESTMESEFGILALTSLSLVCSAFH
jgi:hypothetical protein